MCGIVGAVARENVVPILIEGIRRLEYRGYDSTGLAVINGGLHRLVSTARVADLAAQASATKIEGNTGISHTRWATHGAPTSANAHPHVSSGEIAVVHNGIIENFEPLRARLQQQGYAFVTQTDSEVIAHLIHAHYDGDLLAAVRKAVAEFHGAYAIAAMTAREPGRVVGARAGSPLLVGVGERDHFLASDASALAPVTRRVVYLEEGDIADIGRDGYAIYDGSGARVQRDVVTVKSSGDAVELGPYAIAAMTARDRRYAGKRRRHTPRPVRRRRGRGLGQCQRGPDTRLRDQLLLGDGRAPMARSGGRHTDAGRNRQ